MYKVSAELKRRVESRRFRGKWASVARIAESNRELIGAGGFYLPSAKGGGQGEVRPWVDVGPVPVTQFISLSSVSTDHKTQSSCSEEEELQENRPTSARELPAAPQHSITEVCVANVDTVSACLALGNDVVALNFAHASTPGGRYTHGGRAQEEDLCRLLPHLYPSLATCGHYPIAEDGALLTLNVPVLRRPGTYKLTAALGTVSIISAAMPCGIADRRPRGGWLNSDWSRQVEPRIRAVLHGARVSGHRNVVLGAFGCGAFGNPAKPVADLFRTVLQSPEFRSVFATVVFAVLDPLGTGNLRPFREALGTQDKWGTDLSSSRSTG